MASTKTSGWIKQRAALLLEKEERERGNEELDMTLDAAAI